MVTASAVVAAGAGTIFSESPSKNVVTLPFVNTAAINTSNTTVGFADSDLYGMTPAEVERTLDEMQAMGVNNVRILIPWAGVELADDFYYWDTVDYLVEAADSRGMGILGVLNSTPAWATEPGLPPVVSPPADNEQYTEFVSLAAERYAGKVSAYEVWNEPNAYFYWAPAPDPAAYTELLQAAYPAIKAADPEATVVGGVVGSVTDVAGLAYNPITFVEGMYESGAAGYFDALSLHPYQYTLPFSQGRPYGAAAPITQLETMHELMTANGDGDKLIWTSEYGEPTSVVDEATQAAFIQDYLNTWSEFDYTGPSFIYTTRDRDTDSTVVDDTLGVLRDDFSWKPAAYVIREWTERYPQTVPDAVTLTAFADELEAATGEPLALASMEATEVPQSALTTTLASTETEALTPTTAEALEAVTEAIQTTEAETTETVEATETVETAPVTDEVTEEVTEATDVDVETAPVGRSAVTPTSIDTTDAETTEVEVTEAEDADATDTTDATDDADTATGSTTSSTTGSTSSTTGSTSSTTGSTSSSDTDTGSSDSDSSDSDSSDSDSGSDSSDAAA
ncbi:cellulase family glycosylhydrolase [Mycolicibacterium flavescens]|uniref:cellulase family glycosylhydrolase n=1 Tax=Mycolicibacterium flavescens TaxID=1776 RepID=UPI001F2B5CD6|nr:cellulase family glycosylhydrolase [Mycolicibacterium flavescens]